ncbi:MAG: GMC family oxidoreductase N-terminal domain-containing protein, partial [Bdellovibrionaceae bacterium]|nr:GMC family oxidoreductase N-terminal domain-containing protein [Pseudobdellovibrionaceae bacterium]
MTLSVQEIENKIWDNLVIGTGIGGSVLGYSLAKHGQSVLFCEKGPSLNESDLDNKSLITGRFAEEFINKNTENGIHFFYKNSGRFSNYLLDNSQFFPKKLFPMLGSVTGGSSAIFGMAFERFFPLDFQPNKYILNSDKTSAPLAWPIDYDEIAPYYLLAEELFKVKGSSDPLKSCDTFKYQGKINLHPVNLKLYENLKNQGLHPYQLPKAYDNLPDCQTCQGYLCAKKCKNDAFKICIAPALEKFNSKLLANCEIIKLQSTKDRVTSALAVYQNQLITLKAHRFILGAGAINTPALLLKSKSSLWPDGLANKNKLVGKNLMRHLVDLYSLVLPAELGKTGPHKEIAFNDFYFRENIKLGSIQSFGSLPPANAIVQDLIRKQKLNQHHSVAFFIQKFNHLISQHIVKITENSTLLAATLEDFPYLDNQVSLSKEGHIVIKYKLHNSEINRLKIFRNKIKFILKEFHPKKISLAHKND